MTELETFRRQKDRYFKTGPDSPIPHEQRAGFAGLAYYPESATTDRFKSRRESRGG